ncbi:MAG: DUF262 domain-containing HNH endonuclease family protein [Alphaproteobacteria bacterium]|nr:DUF262 domain-containing HNH endonuclease family protein [Alphaproteobacteria bacterium]
MTSNLRCDDVSVADLFSGHQLYEIPAFQRDFSWTEDEAQRLFDDCVAAMDVAQQSDEPLPLFLGDMVFVASDEPGSSVRSALVVDGQQRLITLTILIAALRDQSAPANRAPLHSQIAVLTQVEPFEFDVFHVRPRACDARFLERAVQRPGATRLPRGKADMKPVNQAQRRMETVRELFVKRIKRMSPHRRATFAEFLLNGCRVLRIWAPDIDYAYRLFLSINKPGLPLSDEDMVLAEVVGPLAVDQRQRYETVIAQMSRYREPHIQGRRQDKTFFTHLAIAQRWTRSDRMIQLLRRVVAKQGGPAKFASEIFEPMAEAYLITRGEWRREALSDTAWDLIDRLRILERFCDSEWVAPAMLAISRLRNDDARLCHFLSQLDRFAHVLVLTRTTADDRRNSYRPIIDAIWRCESASQINPEELFSLDIQREATAVRRAALKIREAANGADKAILIRLDAEMSGRPLSQYLELIDNKFIDHGMLTLEHIVPNGGTLSKASGWRPEFAQVNYRKAIANTIGNLILLERSRNKAAGQADFGEKKRRYFSGRTPHDLALTEALRECDVWSRAQLESRYATMMNLAIKTWSLRGEIPALPAPPGSVAVLASPAAKPAAKGPIAGRRNRVPRSHLFPAGRRNKSRATTKN